MSTPVDIDAVLLATAEGLQGVADGCTNSEFAIQMAVRAQAVRDVHTAVAELIDADCEFDAAHLAYSAAKTGKPRNDAWARVLAAIDRRHAAMKGVVGGAA